MREFKFRAWDKFNKIMIYSDKNYPLSEYKIEFDWTDENKLSLMKLIDARYGEFRTFDAVIMQYTELKDINGKEIYENDIVKFLDEITVKEEGYLDETVVVEKVGVVVWDNEELGYNVNAKYDKYESEVHYLCCCKDAEIVGNIYENPELLK